MAKTISTNEMAVKLGVSPQRVLQLMASRKISVVVRGGPRTPSLWPATAVKALARRKPGRPKGMK